MAINEEAMVTMQPVTYDEGSKLLSSHVCAMCGNGLRMPWGGSYGVNGYVLMCSRDKEHQGTIKERSLSDRYESGEALPIYITQKLERRRQKRMEKAVAKQGQDVGEYLGGKLTKEQASLILTTIWPDAPQVEVIKAAMVCARYGLDPLMKHLFLVKYWNKEKKEYDWSLILGIRATRLIARQHISYGYIAETPRLMTDHEQQRRRGKIDAENIWAITIIVDGKGFQYPGYGNWPKGTPVKGENKGNTPENMAMIRSERAAIDRLCPGLLPEGIDVGEEAYIETEGFEQIPVEEVPIEDVSLPDLVEAPPPAPEPAPAASDSLEGTSDEPAPHTDISYKIEEQPAEDPVMGQPFGAISKISPEQKKAISGLYNERQFAAADFQQLMRTWEAISTADLTQAQAAELIAWLEEKPVKTKML